MGIIEILLTSIGVAMDACAVSICKGLSMNKMNWKKAIVIGLWFGIFQGLMPLIGYLAASTFDDLVISVDHWVAFTLLSFIGIKMIKDSVNNDEEDDDDDISFKTMIILAIATSIDALAVGITLAFLKVNLVLAISSITIITFVLSAIGVKIGNVFGRKYKKKAELAGGIILIFIGIKILIEHLGLI